MLFFSLYTPEKSLKQISISFFVQLEKSKAEVTGAFIRQGGTAALVFSLMTSFTQCYQDILYTSGPRR